jgi:hypothetical protein
MVIHWNGQEHTKVAVRARDGQSTERAHVRALLKREEMQKSRAARKWNEQGRLYDLEHGEPETETEALFRRGR